MSKLLSSFTMFSRFTRLPIRRCLHTIPPRHTASRLRFTIGASAVVTASYLTWRLNTDGQRIALDSATKHPPVKQPAVSPPAAVAPPNSTNSSPEISFVVDPIEENPEVKSTSEPDAVKTDQSDTDAEGGESPDAGTGGAFNPVTGEINWDCPCLGGMAHGPCGPEFREAFSCFVFSEEEPKGINCVEKFKGMQNCFREHPEIYGDEIMDDDDDEPEAGSDTTLQGEQNDVVSKDPSPSHSVNTEAKQPELKENPSPVSAAP